MDILPQEFRQGGDLAIGHARVRTKRKTLLQWHTFSKVPYTEASYSAYARELTFEDFCLCASACQACARTHKTPCCHAAWGFCSKLRQQPEAGAEAVGWGSSAGTVERAGGGGAGSDGRPGEGRRAAVAAETALLQEARGAEMAARDDVARGG